MEYPKFKVCVRCFTFNQAKYIEDAMNGFVMQQTDFPFVCCIVDDASTDGEQDVIKKYMDMHFDYSPNSVSFEKETDYAYIHYARHKENKNCYFAVLLLKENLYSTDKSNLKFNYIAEWYEKCQYEAICEGDDYWIDSRKLQKQVAFLDEHKDYSMCHTGFDFFIQSQGRIASGFKIKDQNLKIIAGKHNLYEEILDGNRYRIQTATVLLRMKLRLQVLHMLKSYDKKFLMGDTQKWLAYLSLGHIGYMPEITSVYRLNEGSACCQKSLERQIRFDLSCAEMRVEMAKLFDLSDSFVQVLMQRYRNNLFKYKCFNVNYVHFIPTNNIYLKDKIKFACTDFKLMRCFFKMWYIFRLRIIPVFFHKYLSSKNLN